MKWTFYKGSFTFLLFLFIAIIANSQPENNPIIIFKGQLFGKNFYPRFLKVMKETEVSLSWHCRIKHIVKTDSNGYFEIMAGVDSNFDFSTSADCGDFDTVLSTLGIKYDTVIKLRKIIVNDYCSDWYLESISFDFNSDKVDTSQISLIDQLSKILKKCDNLVIELGGNCDCRGDSVNQMELSIRRAESVKKILIDFGVPDFQLKIHGYGSDHLVNNCRCKNGKGQGINCTEEEHHQNNRVTFRVVGVLDR